MDAKKKKKKRKIRIDLDIHEEKVVDAIARGLIPYVDFYPRPKGKDYIWVDANRKINFRRDAAIQKSYNNNWKSVLQVAKLLFKTPKEANQVLLRESTVFKSRDTNTFILCAQIERDYKKSKLSKNKFIEQNLEKYCPLVSVDYKEVAKHTRREIQKNKKLEEPGKKDRQPIIDRIVSRYDRLVKGNAKKYKDWLKENSHLVK